MNKKPTAMILKANFDIDQVGETLEWRFSRHDGDGNPIKGPDAGGLYFTVGEEFRVRVTAGNKDPFRSFRVIDCALITRPQIFRCGPDIPTEFAPPSLFKPALLDETVGAVVNLRANKFEPRMVEPPKDYYQITQEWTDHLTVGEFVGRWELSFIITVSITRADGTTFLRVLGFDPEAQVGNGTTPPN